MAIFYSLFFRNADYLHLPWMSLSLYGKQLLVHSGGPSIKAILQISEVVFYFKGFVMRFVKLFKLLKNKHLTHTAVDGDKQVKRYYCSYSSFVSPILTVS